MFFKICQNYAKNVFFGTPTPKIRPGGTFSTHSFLSGPPQKGYNLKNGLEQNTINFIFQKRLPMKVIWYPHKKGINKFKGIHVEEHGQKYKLHVKLFNFDTRQCMQFINEYKQIFDFSTFSTFEK